MLPQPDVTRVNGTTDGGDTKLDDVMGAGFCLLAIGTDAATALAGLDHPVWAHLNARRVALIPGVTGNAKQAGSQAGSHAGINDTDTLQTVSIAANALPRKLEPYKGKILLIRPDRYVAAACTPGAMEETMADTMAAQIGVAL